MFGIAGIGIGPNIGAGIGDASAMSREAQMQFVARQWGPSATPFYTAELLRSMQNAWPEYRLKPTMTLAEYDARRKAFSARS